jgi:uncharacterized YigZ family protein
MIPNPDQYFSIAGESSGSYREKASKFIAFAYPVTNEVEVKEKLGNLKKVYHDANHFCFAYRIGHDHLSYRFNDDGEPSGSAGKPIFGQILSHNLTDLLVVVIRYFGGKKLGIPGLINAYRTSAKAALDSAKIIPKFIYLSFRIQFPYKAMNEVMKVLKDEEAKISMETTEKLCQIIYSIKKSKEDEVRKKLIRISCLTLSEVN